MKLKDYRLSNGLTLAEFSRAIDVAESTVSRYENGRVPDPEIMERIYVATCGIVGPLDFYKFVRTVNGTPVDGGEA